MINKPRKESMRQVKDGAAPEKADAKQSPTYARAVAAAGAVGEKPVFFRGARVKK